MSVSRRTALSLPHTMPGGTDIDLRFVADATVGVKLDYVRHKVSSNHDFVTHLDDPATLEELDGRLWEVGYTLLPEATEGTSVVSPKDAASFEAWDVSLVHGTSSPAEALLFVWKGIKIPGARNEDEIEVSMLVRLDTDDKVSRWYPWVTRKRGNSCTIDFIEGPILWVKGPALPNGAETHRQGQQRTRLLTTAVGINKMPLWTNNTRFDLWSAAGGAVSEVENPQPNQALQFTAIVSMNNISTPDPAFRRILYLGSEDTGYWNKTYRYRGYNYTAGGADDAYVRWAIRHYPPWTHSVGDETQRVEWSNDAATRYPVTIGVLQAVDDYFYYDVCEYYRDRMIALGAMPPKIESNSRIASAMARGPNLFVATIDVAGFWPLNRQPIDIYPNYLEVMREVVKGCESAHITDPTAYLHLQSWVKNLPTVDNAADPFRDHPVYSVDDQVPELVVNAAAEDIRVSVYSIPSRWRAYLNRSQGIPPEAIRRNRDGSIYEEFPFNGAYNTMTTSRISLEGAKWWQETMAADMAGAGFAGAYLDIFAGSGYERDFPTHETRTKNADRNATPYKVEFLRRTREELLKTRVISPSAPDTDAIVLSEVAEEGLMGEIDWVTEHHSYHPTQMMLAEDAVSGAVTNLPEACRHLNPELTVMVYHAYQPIQNITVHFGNALLATNTDWQPTPLGFSGLTPDEFQDLNCWHFAANLIAGSHPVDLAWQNIFNGYDEAVTTTPSGVPNHMVLRRADGSLYTDPVKDPTGVGLKVMAFMKTCYESEVRAYAGQFTIMGDFMRPIAVDHSSANVDTVQNPMRVLSQSQLKVDTLGVGRLLLLPTNTAILRQASPTAFLFASADFQVPAVMASMWRSPEGVVGLVLANWTRSGADWVGTFDPAKYGITPPYDIDQLVLGGSATSLATGVGAGATTIGTSGATPTVDLGASIPAQSVTVITFS